MPFSSLFTSLAANLHSIAGSGGYALLFIFTLLEGVPVLGMLVPGHVMIIVAGFLSRIGALNLYVVIILALVGAIMGDYIGFLIGRKYGLAFIDRVRPYFFVTDGQITRARAFLAKHTGKAMIIGRFTPATRALMPFLVGAGDTPAPKFWLFNVIGGVSWAVLSVLVGYAFGVGYHAAAGFFGRMVTLAIVGGIIIIWGYRFINSRFHVFRKYELFTLALNLVSLWALAETIQDALALKSSMANFDIWVNTMSARYMGPVLIWIGSAVSTVGGTAVTAGLGILIGVWFAWKRKWRSAAIAILSIGSTGVFVELLKEFFNRARPENAVQVILNDPSFPSGHSALAAAFFVLVAYLFAPKIKSWIARELTIVACVLGVFVIGMSRLVLNVHWASDVIAGWALGAFMATSSILLVRYIGNLFVKKPISAEEGSGSM